MSRTADDSSDIATSVGATAVMVARPVTLRAV